MKISHEELTSRLCSALREKYGYDEQQFSRYYLMETFPDYVIARVPEGKLYRIEYSLDTDDNVSLGDAQEVETAYVPVSPAVSVVITDSAATSGDGYTWPVQRSEK